MRGKEGKPWRFKSYSHLLGWLKGTPRKVCDIVSTILSSRIGLPRSLKLLNSVSEETWDSLVSSQPWALACLKPNRPWTQFRKTLNLHQEELRTYECSQILWSSASKKTLPSQTQKDSFLTSNLPREVIGCTLNVSKKRTNWVQVPTKTVWTPTFKMMQK